MQRTLSSSCGAEFACSGVSVGIQHIALLCCIQYTTLGSANCSSSVLAAQSLPSSIAICPAIAFFVRFPSPIEYLRTLLLACHLQLSPLAFVLYIGYIHTCLGCVCSWPCVSPSSSYDIVDLHHVNIALPRWASQERPGAHSFTVVCEVGVYGRSGEEGAACRTSWIVLQPPGCYYCLRANSKLVGLC